jgi:hypothetical protein
MKHALLFAMVMLSACSVRNDFTAISGKNVNLSQVTIEKKHSLGKAYGEDCQSRIIFFPTGGPATFDEALDRAQESKQANLLVDAVVKHEVISIPLIYGNECWKVEGTAYDTFK